MNRTFKALTTPSQTDDSFELSWSERFDESGVSWEELLKSQRILIVSEAGAGKTYECESKARELFARGEPAFFLSLERVASSGVVATLFGDEHERFTNWLASSSQAAYFFLDSIDELQLAHQSFKDALRRFAHDIRGALGRTTVVITARPVLIDRQAFRDILHVPAPVRQEDSQDEFIRIAMDGPSKTKDDSPPTSREVELLPLTGPQIIEFARARGVEDPEALLAAVDAKQAREFARKPQDLIELCDDWRENGLLRAHFEQIKTHMRARLAARPDRPEKAELPPAKAQIGAQRLALAVILSRRLTIRYSAGSDGDASGAAPIVPRELLSDWGPNEVFTLLERPIFVEGGYGRVRFHPSNEQKLSQVVRVLLAHAGAEITRPVAELAAAEVRAAGTGPYLLFWLPVLFSLAPLRGVEFMLAVLATLPVESNGAAVRIIGSLFSERTDAGLTDWLSKLAPDQLLQLTLEFHRHARPEDDIVHNTGYRPGARDFAEDGRRYVFDALMKASGPEALIAKLALAADPLFERLRDRIAALAQERVAADIDTSAWTPTEVATLLSRKELAPKTATDMAHLLVDRLDDLQELLLRDTSPRAGWAAIDDENTLRPMIAHVLEVASREAYTVDQEAVTADGKETDIRLRAVSGYQATIELKVGEKGRSARELCDTIENQLVKKYMAHRDARTGCLLVSVADPGRYWVHPETGERIDRFGLQTLLQAKADEVQRRLGGEARVLARVLDLTPRLSTEKFDASGRRQDAGRDAASLESTAQGRD